MHVALKCLLTQLTVGEIGLWGGRRSDTANQCMCSRFRLPRCEDCGCGKIESRAIPDVLFAECFLRGVFCMGANCPVVPDHGTWWTEQSCVFPTRSLSRPSRCCDQTFEAAGASTVFSMVAIDDRFILPKHREL